MNVQELILSIPKSGNNYDLTKVTPLQRHRAKELLQESAGNQRALLKEVIETGTLPWQIRRAATSLVGRIALTAALPAMYFFGMPALLTTAAVFGAIVAQDRWNESHILAKPVPQIKIAKAPETKPVVAVHQPVIPAPQPVRALAEGLSLPDSIKGIENVEDGRCPNNCWMNAVMQMVLRNKHILKCFDEPGNLGNFKFFKGLIEFYNNGGLAPLKTGHLTLVKKWLLEKMDRQLNPEERWYHQQDASEALQAIFGSLPDEEARGVFVTPRIFLGAAQRESQEIERTFGTVAMAIPDRGETTLDEVIKDHANPNRVATYNENGVECDVSEGWGIQTFPPCLNITLKRFNANSQKIHTPVLIGEELELEDTSGKKGTYVLNSVIVHKGATPNSGHYVAYVKRDGIWFEANDDRVTPISFEQIPLKEIYILQYELKEAVS